VVVYDGLCNACEMAAKRLHQIDFGVGRLAFLFARDRKARLTQAALRLAPYFEHSTIAVLDGCKT